LPINLCAYFAIETYDWSILRYAIINAAIGALPIARAVLYISSRGPFLLLKRKYSHVILECNILATGQRRHFVIRRCVRGSKLSTY